MPIILPYMINRFHRSVMIMPQPCRYCKHFYHIFQIWLEIKILKSKRDRYIYLQTIRNILLPGFPDITEIL